MDENNENNGMPSMPGMPSIPSEDVAPANLPGELVADEAPEVESSEDAAPEVTPEVPVKVIDPGKDIESELVLPKAPAGGIAVTATMKGFYGQMRKKEGDKFNVAKFESLGEWMICDDKEVDKKRKEFLRLKKIKKAKK